MNLEQVIAKAKKHRFADLAAISRLARPTVELHARRRGRSTAPTSRLGGLPDLPRSVPWPRKGERSLAFIAQVELSEQPPVAAEEGFPRNGRLLFFYEAEEGPWGFDPNDVGGFAVIHVPDCTSPVEVYDWPHDLPDQARYQVCSLVPEKTITLPPWESVLIEELKLDRDQMDAYMDLVQDLTEEDVWASRALLGGYPDQVQGDMTLECALVSAGLRYDALRPNDKRWPTVRKQAADWRLLLQVPSVEAAGMMWGDVGCLYYWIRDPDLRAGHFDRAWMILQCG